MIFGIAFVMVLSEVGMNVAPILASAGVLGLAIGFGAQNLVKDFLSGVMMMIEDQYGVGDAVDLGEAIGTVENVGLRVTRVRDVDGTVWYVRNGEILRVGNQSQNWARTVLDIKVGYREDLVRVRQILQEVAHGLWEDEDYKDVIIEEPEVWGVEDLSPDAVVDAGDAEDRADGAVAGRARDAGTRSRAASTTRTSRSRCRSGSSGTASRAARAQRPRHRRRRSGPAAGARPAESPRPPE